MATAQEVMKKFMSSLDNTYLTGTEALDEATRASSSFNSWQDVINQMVSDCASYDGDGERFLREKCGIELYNEDTGAITGYDAGTNTVKTAESIVPESGDWVSPSGSSTTISDLTVNWPDSSSLTQAQKTIVSGLNTWWIEKSLSLIKDSYGLSFEESNPTVKEITVNFVNDNSSTLAYVEALYRRSGFFGTYKVYNLSLNINMNYYNDISSTDSNGVYSGADKLYFDRIIAHELTHAVVMATVGDSYNLPIYFGEGIAELTHGIDDTRKSEILTLANNSSKLNQVIWNDSSSDTRTYAGGYMLFRYFAKQASDNQSASVSSSDALPSGADLYGTTLVLSSSFSGSVWLQGWDLFAGKEVYRNDSVVTIDATQTISDGMILAGNWLDNVIKAGSGSAYLWGGDGGNDTLVGGSGRDMFWLGTGCGADVAENFSVGDGNSSDIVNFYLGGLGPIYRNNGNLVLTIEDGSSLSLNVGTSVESVIQYSFDSQNIFKAKVGNTYESNALYYDSSVSFYRGGELTDTLMVTGDGEHQIWLDGSHGKLFDSIDNIDATNSYGTYDLVGDYRDNIISSGNGVTSLFGGWGGNDTLNGGAGQDMFWCGRNLGDDVINNVSENDTVNLFNTKLSDISGINVSDNNIYLSFYEGGSVSVMGGASAGNTFILGEDGVSWKYNNNDSSWYTV